MNEAKFFQKNYKGNFFKTLLIVVFALSAIGFIVSSFGDGEIAEFFARGFYNTISKIGIVFMDELGVYIFEPVAFILFAIGGETFVFYQKKIAKRNLFENREGACYIYYIVSFLCFGLFLGFQTVSRFGNFNDGFGLGFDAKLGEMLTGRLTAYGIVRSIQVSLMICGTIGMRKRFAKRTDILEQEYGIDAFKGMLYMMFLALMILVVKGSMGRPYYFNNIGVEILERIEERGFIHDPSVIRGGGGYSGLENVPYLEWWQPNNFGDNLKYGFGEGGHLGSDGGGSRAFPSGHTTSTFAAFGLGFCFIGENKGRKITTKKIIGLLLCLILLKSMKFSLLVYRFHGLSDLEFSTMYSIIMIPATIRLVDKHLMVFINKFRWKITKQEFSAIYVETRHGFKLFIEKSYGLQYVGFFFKGNYIDNKIAKIAKRYKISKAIDKNPEFC